MYMASTSTLTNSDPLFSKKIKNQNITHPCKGSEG